MRRKFWRSFQHEDASHHRMPLHPTVPTSEEEVLRAQGIVSGLSPQHPTAPQARQDYVLRMQSVIGNAAVQRLLSEQTSIPAAPQIRRWFWDEEEETTDTSETEDSGGSWWGDDEEETTETEDSGDSWWDSDDAEEESEEPEEEESSWWDDLWEDDEESEEEESEEGEEGELMTMVEPFEPLPSGGQPDRHIHVARVDSGGEPVDEVAAPKISFTDKGRVGTVPYEVNPIAEDDQRPHAFTNGGQSGTVVWAGGGGAGAHGNESVGSLQTHNKPVYESRSNGLLSDSDAWVKAGTGNIDVTRSWVGINSGDQGNGHFVTAGAATRINNHEVLHVNSTKGHYDTNIAPLLTRTAGYTFNPSGGYSMATAYTQLGAMWNLSGILGWGAAVSAFQTGDTADNTPMGTVDTNDIGTGTYPVDAGPGKVGGTDFQHRVRLPSEPNPA